MTSRKIKMIGVSVETYQYLSSLKKPGEPFDDLILRLINQRGSSVGSYDVELDVDELFRHKNFVDLVARIAAMEEINKQREVPSVG